MPIARRSWRARREDGVRIDIAADVARDVGTRSASPSASATNAGSSAVSANTADERRDQAVVVARRAAGADRSDVLDQQGVRERLHRLPAIERIGVVRGEEHQVIARLGST